jgi:tape measure domain-containing protein
MIDVETIGIAVSTEGVVRGRKELDNFGNSAEKASRKADDTSSAIAGMAKGFVGFTAALAGLSKAVGVFDEYAKYSAILKNATSGQAEFNKAMSDVTKIANIAQTDVAGLAQVYARFTNSLKEFGTTQEQVTTLTQTVALALKANGATAAETSSAMLQLSQAFGAGRLSGDEFRSMAEGAPNLMRALAKSIGVPTGALKEMAAEGQLTNDVLLKAFTDPALAKSMEKQAADIITLSGAWQLLKTELSQVFIDFEKATGIFESFAISTMQLAHGIGIIRNFLKGDQVGDLTNDLKNVTDQLAAYDGGNAFDKQVLGGKEYRKELLADMEELSKKLEELTAAPEVNPASLSTTATIDQGWMDKQSKDYEKQLEKLNAQRKKAADEAAKYERELADAESAWKANKANEYQEQLRKDFEKAKKEEAKLAEELAKEEYKSKLKYMELLSKQAEKNYDEAQKAAKKAADDLEKEYQRISDNISRSLTDAIFRGFENGKSFVESFIDGLKSSFKATILQPVTNLLVDSTGLTAVMAAFSTMMSGTANAGSVTSTLIPSGGSIFDKGLNIVKSITSGFDMLNTGFGKSIEELGALIYNGNGGLIDEIGGFMGQYGTQISQALGYAGAALAGFNYLKDGNYIGAGLTAAGAYFGPVGAAVGAALGSLFGGKVKTKKYSTGVTGNYSDGKFTSSNQSGLAGYGRALGGNDGLASVLKDYSTVVSGLFGAYGMNGDVNTSASLFQRSSKKTRAWGYFGANAGGGSVSFSSGDVAFGSAEAAMQALVEKILTQGITGLVATSKLPEGIRALFDGLGDKTSVQAMINASINIGNAQEALIKQYNLTADAAGKVAIASGYSGEQLAQFANALAMTALSSQKTSITILKERDALKDIIGSLPDSVTAFDAILKSINTATGAGQEQFAELFELRDRFSQYTSAFDSVVGNVESAIYGMLSPSEKMALDQANLAKAFTELNLAVPTSINELIALGKSIDYGTEAGLDLAMAFPALVAMFNQTKEAANALMQDLSANYFSTRADYMSARASDSPQSYIKNQAQMNTEMLAEIKKLQQDGADTKAVMLAVAEYTAKFQRTIDDWDSEGMPAVRTDV